MTRAGVALLLALCAGCIVDMGTTTTVTPPEERVPVPDKYEAGQAPELVDGEVEGCQRALTLDPNLYYCAKEEHWFRYAMNRWYLAFAWDGNWFPVTGKELPPGLVAITPAPEEVVKSREKRLEVLDKQLEDLDNPQPSAAPTETPQDAEKSRDDKLEQLERQLEELDEEQPPQGGH